MKVIVYKIGHDENNQAHLTDYGIFKSVIGNSREGSQYYNPMNQYLSEFSTIKTILDGYNYDEYDYVGICHYRTLIGDIPEGLSYLESLKLSEEIIMNSLNDGYVGIRSTPIKSKFNNSITRARWTGSQSISTIWRFLIEHSSNDLVKEFTDYQRSYDNSYRTCCVLKRNDFIQLFDAVTSSADYFMKQRELNGSLYPRSVGYELETLTSFLLCMKSRFNNFDRIKNTVIKV